MKKVQVKHLKVIVPVVLVIIAIGLFVVWSNSPNQGRLSDVSYSNASNVQDDKTLDGTYLKLKYLGKYSQKKEIPGNGDVERYTLSADTRYDKRTLVSVSDLQDDRLESNGAYIFRQKNPSLYDSRIVKVADKMVTVWVRKDGTEQTAMIPKGDKLAIISLVTTNTKDDLTTEADDLLNTFEWKQ